MEKTIVQRFLSVGLVAICVAGCFALVVNNRVVGIGRHYILNQELMRDRYALEQQEAWDIRADDLDGNAGELPFDCILVLGAQVKKNGEPSWTLADRCQVGVEAYQMGLSDRLLLTGDHGQIHYDEVTAMQTFCEDKGVPSEAIFLDHAGFSTYESMVRAKEIFGAKKILLVTQRFHLYRALYMARSLGMEAYGMDSALRQYGPRTEAVNAVREFAARVKGWINIELRKPAPRYLGDPIDLRGSGKVTHEDAKE